MKTENPIETWASAWPDALAFAVGLAVAWWTGWNAGDLVWSLWLSSLVVGYSVIIWTIAQPAFELGRTLGNDGAVSGAPVSPWAVWSMLFAGALLFLGFFTVHFGMFHYIHSQLLISFFPIESGSAGHLSWGGASSYSEIVRRYWPFLPAAFLAERAAFMRKPLSLEGDASLVGFVSAVAGKPAKARELFAGPYRNVARIHMLIFFFFFAHFAKLDNFAVYAVVYAVYFFPWRLLRRSRVEPARAVRIAVPVICLAISCAPPDTQRIPAAGSAPVSQPVGDPTPLSAQPSPDTASTPLPPGYSLTDTAVWGNPVEDGKRAILRRGKDAIDTVALEFDVVTVGKDSLIFLAVRHHTELFIPGDSTSGYESFPTEYVLWTPWSRRELRDFLPFFKSDNSSPIVSNESVIHYWGIATPAPAFRVYAMRYDFRTARLDSLFTHVDDLASDYRYYLPVPRVSDTVVTFGGSRLGGKTWQLIPQDPPSN